MEVLTYLLEGFRIAFIPVNLFYAFVGVFVGTLIGVLPGIGPAGAISILIPISFRIPPVPAIIMLAGIYYGAQYGGSTTSILVNIPGEASSVITCLDGYQMARQGRAGPALGMAAFGSFIAGTFSVIGLMILAFPLAKVALRFGPPRIFWPDGFGPDHCYLSRPRFSPKSFANGSSRDFPEFCGNGRHGWNAPLHLWYDRSGRWHRAGTISDGGIWDLRGSH